MIAGGGIHKILTLFRFSFFQIIVFSIFKFKFKNVVTWKRREFFSIFKLKFTNFVTWKRREL